MLSHTSKGGTARAGRAPRAGRRDLLRPSGRGCGLLVIGGEGSREPSRHWADQGVRQRGEPGEPGAGDRGGLGRPKPGPGEPPQRGHLGGSAQEERVGV